LIGRGHIISAPIPPRLSLFHSAVFNELYYLADGGSVWLDVDPGESIPSTDLRYLPTEAIVLKEKLGVHGRLFIIGNGTASAFWNRIGISQRILNDL
jgi:hypothetical protein